MYKLRLRLDAARRAFARTASHAWIQLRAFAGLLNLPARKHNSFHIIPALVSVSTFRLVTS